MAPSTTARSGSAASWSLLCGTFFFASAAASAGYLTVSEVFPLETRSHGHRALLRDLDRHRRRRSGRCCSRACWAPARKSSLFLGYAIASALMLRRAAVVAWIWGVDAEQESLEEIAEPLSAHIGGGGMTRHIWSPGPLASGAVEPAGLADRETRGHRLGPAPRGPARQPHAARARRGALLGARTLRLRLGAARCSPGAYAAWAAARGRRPMRAPPRAASSSARTLAGGSPWNSARAASVSSARAPRRARHGGRRDRSRPRRRAERRGPRPAGSSAPASSAMRCAAISAPC